MTAKVRHLGILPKFDPESGPNGELFLEWNGSGELTKITKKVGRHTWEKTLTWTGGYPTHISDWVEV